MDSANFTETCFLCRKMVDNNPGRTRIEYARALNLTLSNRTSWHLLCTRDSLLASKNMDHIAVFWVFRFFTTRVHYWNFISHRPRVSCLKIPHTEKYLLCIFLNHSSESSNTLLRVYHLRRKNIWYTFLYLWKCVKIPTAELNEIILQNTTRCCNSGSHTSRHLQQSILMF